MIDLRYPKPLHAPLQVHSLLAFSQPEESALPICVAISLDQVVLRRLFDLWNTLLILQADEIGDWSLKTSAQLSCDRDVPLPAVLTVGATVYANGEVEFAVMLEGVDQPAKTSDQLDLNSLQRAETARQSPSGATR